jgi:hypothetical protein
MASTNSNSEVKVAARPTIPAQTRPSISAQRLPQVTLAAVSLALVGGAAYLALRHLKRRSH